MSSPHNRAFRVAVVSLSNGAAALRVFTLVRQPRFFAHTERENIRW